MLDRSETLPLHSPLAFPALALVASCAGAGQLGDEPPTARPTAMAALVERFSADHGALRRFHSVEESATRLERLDDFERGWLDRLKAIDFDGLGQGERIDHVLLRRHIEHGLGERATFRERLEELEELLPFAETIITLEERRWRVEPIDPRGVAEVLNGIEEAVDEIRDRVEDGDDGEGPALDVSETDAL